MSEIKIPKIRIAGYEKGWQKKPFGEMVMRSSASSVSPFLPHIEYEDIVSGRGYLNKDPLDKINCPKQGLLFQPGDLLFGKLRAYLQNNFLATFQGIAVGDFWVLRPKENGKFLFNLIKTEPFQKIANTSIGTKMPRSDWGFVSAADYYIPELNEQKDIARIIDCIEISIQKCELELLKLTKTKKAYRSLLFPRPGEKKPRLRFKGFIEDWECIKGDEIFSTINDKGHPELPVLSASQEYGMIYRDVMGYQISHDKSNEISYKRVLPGQFVIHLRSFQGGFAHSSVEGITSPAYTILDIKNKNHNYDLFWKYIFNSKPFIKRLEIVTYGIRDGRSINFEDFKELSFLVPKYEEQKAIADFLVSLDSLIQTNRRRIELLKHIKLACLEGMFVN